MLSLKEFESSMKSVSAEEVLKRKAKGQYMPYIEMVLKKARMIPVGRSVEIDLKDPKQAFALSQAFRGYLKKIGSEEFVAGSHKTFVICGRREKTK